MSREEPSYTHVDQTRPTGFKLWLYLLSVHTCALIGRIFLFWRTFGTENIPRSGPLLVVGNHPSYLDPPTLVATVIYYADRDLSTMAWDKLFKIPFVSFFTRHYKSYPVNRENPGRGPYLTLLHILKNGGAASVFPEGSRSHQRLMGPWKPGALRAAFATEATILPVTVLTAPEFWPRKNWRPRFFRPHHVIIHKPIPYAEFAGETGDGAKKRAAEEALAERLRGIINGPLIEREREWKAYHEELAMRQDPLRQDSRDAISPRFPHA